MFSWILSELQNFFVIQNLWLCILIDHGKSILPILHASTILWAFMSRPFHLQFLRFFGQSEISCISESKILTRNFRGIKMIYKQNSKRVHPSTPPQAQEMPQIWSLWNFKLFLIVYMLMWFFPSPSPQPTSHFTTPLFITCY